MARSAILATLVTCVLAACSAGAAPSATPPPPQAPPVIAPSPSVEVARSPAPTSTDPATSATPASTPRSGSVAPPLDLGTVAASLADEGLRMRSLPSVGAGSERYEPLLPVGVELFLLDGPVEADGYPWYQVAPIATDFPHAWGWVAGASRDGEPWLTPVSTRCPALPTDVRGLYGHDFGTEMACFGGEPITVTARILDCGCSIDPGETIEPRSFGWQFTDEGAGPLLLLPPGTDLISEEYLGYAALLRVATDADVPDPLPLGEDVEVTGMFDAPAAAACRYDEAFDGVAEASPYCRGLFLVSAIR